MAVVHIVREFNDEVDVWLDCDEHAAFSGLCLGIGDDATEALLDARQELVNALAEVDRRLKVPPAEVPIVPGRTMGQRKIRLAS